ncbi:Card1-like endonuclease domain-containing protein [Clostridium nigeriense]|uniref:Card1-like endonuclease domain-containing protein n=1 Tax=Clostridium nigeriense TaxID=1805470 RepID=UPI003D341DD1
MKIDILVNQLDSHNEANILATKRFNPKEVIFIYNENDEVLMNSLKKYYETYLRENILKMIAINEGDLKSLSKSINENKNKNIIVNLTGGSRINSLELLNICKDNSIKAVYIDIKNKKLYEFDSKIEVINEEYEDLELDKLLRASGGEVINDSTELSNKKDLVLLTKKIYKNLATWHKYKQKLYESNIFIHDAGKPKEIKINLSLLENEEKVLLNKILKNLKEIKGIEYFNESSEEVKVYFKNEYLKSFIFKSGTWLEIATSNIINEIREIDEVKSGVMFLWNDKSKIVRNEVDVIAMKDSIPICISCKDSDKYNEDALNELDVYSKQIGGKNTYKILVATKEPIKAAVKDRAKEMGINIIIFDGNEEKFKNQIKSIIIKK